MEMNDRQPVATRGSCRIHPCPAERASLNLSESCSLAEFEQIKAGLVPREMEDKWFMFFEEPWLFIHRSWTGFCIYGVRWESSARGATTVEAWVSRNTEQYRETRTEYDEKLLRFLIEALLLKRKVAFPIPTEVAESAPAGVYQHAVVGRAYPETAVNAPERTKLSLWERIRSRLKK